MTLPLIKPAGWDEEDPLTSDEMNAFQAALVRALDGQDGGTYDLQDDLVFTGDGVVVIDNELSIEPGATLDMDGTLALGGQTDLTGQFDVESTGDINVKSGGDINVQSGGAVDVESGGRVNVLSGGSVEVASGGDININAGGEINVDGGAQVDVGGDLNVLNGGELNVQSGGKIDVESGGDINILSGARIVGSAGAEVQVNDVDDLKINAGSYVFRVALTPMFVGSNWAAEVTGTFRNVVVSSSPPGNTLLFPLRLPLGDTITTLRMTINGGAGGGHGGSAPADRPLLQLCRLNINGTLTQIQSVADPVNTGPSYDIPHQVTMSGGSLPYLINSDELLVVRVIGEGLTGGIDNETSLCSIDGTALARSVRQATEFY